MKNKLNKRFKAFLNFLQYNKQFCAYVILSLLCCIFLRFYTIGNPTDIKPFLFDLAMSLIIGAFCFFYKPQKQFTYLFTCLILLIIVCVVNSIYYRFYSSFASFCLIAALGQVGEVGNAVFAKMDVWQFLYLLAPTSFYLFNRKLTNRDYFNFVAKFEKCKTLFKKVILAGSVVLVICIVTLSGTAFSRLAKQWNREYIVNRFGIVVYQINDLINIIKTKINTCFGYDQALKSFNDYYNENTISKSNNDYTNKYENYNVVFVHMESMTSFLIDLNINGTNIAPNLTKLSKEGLYFSNFY